MRVLFVRCCLKENNLSDSRVLTTWSRSGDPESGDGVTENININGIPVVVSAYFDHNISVNLNCGRDDEAYVHYCVPTPEETESARALWREAGAPELVMNARTLSYVFGEEVSAENYSAVYILRNTRIWKSNLGFSAAALLARNDIVGEYGLETLSDPGEVVFAEGLRITEEMRQQYENGVPVEEILKPILDAMFGEEK